MRKLLTSIMLLTTLAACSQAPSTLIVSPVVTIPTNNTLQGKQLSFAIQDMRKGSHLVQIIKKEQAAKLISAHQPLAKTISAQLTSGFKSQELNILPSANMAMTVIINKGLIEVLQENFEYQTHSTISLTIEIQSSQGRLTKTFTSKGKSNGPLKADIAVLGRDFNQLLAKLLAQVLENNEIKQYIRAQA